MSSNDVGSRAIPISAATPNDRDRMLSTLTLAFIRDPLARWCYPNAHDYLTSMPATFDALGGPAYAQGTAHYCGAYSGVALWLPPGVQADGQELTEIMRRTLDPGQFAALQRAFAQMEIHYPAEPCWYLAVLGVDASQQGNGCGSALLAHMLRRIDEDHAMAALESSNPRNVPFYARFGFEITAHIQVPGGPLLFSMMRPAR